MNYGEYETFVGEYSNKFKKQSMSVQIKSEFKMTGQRSEHISSNFVL